VHGFTLEIPPEYRPTTREGHVAIAFFHAYEQSSREIAGVEDVLSGAELTEEQRAIPAFRALREHVQSLSPSKRYLPNGGSFTSMSSFAVLWLTREELEGPLCAPPDRSILEGFTGGSGESAWTVEEAGHAARALVLVPIFDPNAGKSPIDAGIDEDGIPRDAEDARKDRQANFDANGYVQVRRDSDEEPDVEGLDVEDYPDFYKAVHLGGTSYAVQGVPRGLSPRYVELEDDFGAINFGGGNGQLDLETGELTFAN
jgi:hypothetical protein